MLHTRRIYDTDFYRCPNSVYALCQIMSKVLNYTSMLASKMDLKGPLR